jgi:Fe-S-cluster-containing dehydrogenase component
MSPDPQSTREPDEPRERPGGPLTRRSFVRGMAVTAGVLAAGALPAIVTEASAVAAGTPAAASAPTNMSESAPMAAPGGTAAVRAIAEADKPVNYPGSPVFYAKPAGNEKWAMVIDVKACVGCRKCVYACVKENNIGRTSGFTYIQVLEMEPGSIDLDTSDAHYAEGGRPDRWYLPVQCMHCAKPTCVYGCPVTATWKDPDGIVLVDYNKCIACRNCMVTCPYSARHFNWVEPYVPKSEINPAVPLEQKASVIEKCTFCVQRVRRGGTTACTEACPVGARTFGDLNDPNSAVAELLRTRRVFRLKEELGNEPMIWYVG